MGALAEATPLATATPERIRDFASQPLSAQSWSVTV
jgi:hypothetical protein